VCTRDCASACLFDLLLPLLRVLESSGVFYIFCSGRRLLWGLIGSLVVWGLRFGGASSTHQLPSLVRVAWTSLDEVLRLFPLRLRLRSPFWLSRKGLTVQAHGCDFRYSTPSFVWLSLLLIYKLVYKSLYFRHRPGLQMAPRGRHPYSKLGWDFFICPPHVLNCIS
jgi:hypothetical protein